MNEAIELHASELAAITWRGDQAVISLSPAYIHRSAGTPGASPGFGCWQSATLIIGGASLVSKPARFPAAISNRSLCLGTRLYDNIIPACGTFEDATELSLVLVTGEVFVIRGKQFAIRLHEDPHPSIENFDL